MIPSQNPISPSSQETLPVAQRAQVNLEPISESNPPSVGKQKLNELASNDSTKSNQLVNKTRIYHSLRKPNLPLIDRKWYITDAFEMVLSKSDIGVNKRTKLTKGLLIMAVDLIGNRANADCLGILNSHTESLRAKHSVNYKPEQLDFFLYLFAKKIWSHVTSEISDRTNRDKKILAYQRKACFCIKRSC